MASPVKTILIQLNVVKVTSLNLLIVQLADLLNLQENFIIIYLSRQAGRITLLTQFHPLVFFPDKRDYLFSEYFQGPNIFR